MCIYICINYNFFIHSSINAHSGCFHILAVIDSTTINMEVHIFFLITFSFSLSRYPEVELLNHTVALFLIFRGNSIRWRHQFTFPVTMHKSSLFSASLPTLVNFCLFDDGNSDRCEVISHCDSWCLAASFYVPVGHLYVFFGKMYIFKSDFIFCYWVAWVLYILWLLTTY